MLTQTAPPLRPIATRPAREKIKRISHAGSVYAQSEGADGVVGAATAAYRITPVFAVDTPRRDPMPPRSFSAQLLELGLKHGLEDLVRKAGDDASRANVVATGTQVDRASQFYDHAQSGFTDDLHLFTFVA